MVIRVITCQWVEQITVYSLNLHKLNIYVESANSY